MTNSSFRFSESQDCHFDDLGGRRAESFPMPSNRQRTVSSTFSARSTIASWPRAAALVPSEAPRSRAEPAKVVTAPETRSILRMTWLNVSAT